MELATYVTMGMGVEGDVLLHRFHLLENLMEIHIVSVVSNEILSKNNATF